MFFTDWICILTSGTTIDGREISAEVVRQLAETYDPVNKHTAYINLEHNRHGIKLGSVLALKTKENGDAVKLMAQLKPNDYLLSWVQQGQKAQTSVEYVLNYAKTGLAYLVGLALTDNPASAGTTPLRLSAQQEFPDVQFSSFSDSTAIEPPTPSLFEKFTKPKEENPMDKATLEALQQVTISINSLNENVEKMTAQSTSQDAPADPPPGDEPAPSTQTEPDESETAKQLSALSEQVAALNNKLAQLEQNTDEPHRILNTGGSTGTGAEDAIVY